VDCHHNGGCAVNETAVDAVLINQSCSFQPTAYGSRDRRMAKEAEKLFRLPPTYLV